MENNKENNDKVLQPPYLSISRLNKLYDLISSRSLSEINTEYLTNYGFSKPDAYLGVAALRFLGIIDDKGKTNELIRKFQLRGEQREKEISDIIKKAYKSLFDIVERPQDLSVDDLANEFLHAYKISSRRVADPGVRAFLFLCEQAGLREKTIQVRERKENDKTMNKSQKDSEKGLTRNRISKFKQKNTEIMEQIEGLSLNFSGGIKLIFPNNDSRVSQAVALGELKKVAEAIEDFAKKFMTNQSDNKLDIQKKEET